MKVIAVDDDEIVRVIVGNVVRAAGHECVVAPDGAAAWDAYVAGGADVIISDWRMPGLDGLELCRRVRASLADHYTYLVLATAMNERADVMQGIQAGADGYLHKPLDHDDIRIQLVAAERVTGLHRQLAAQRTELERLNGELAATARIDPLTGLGNRRSLEEDLEQFLARSRRYGHELAVVLVDVDHFKAYNDRYGHLAGDDVLRRLAGAMRAVGRDADRFYRYGGEEFVVLMPDTDQDRAVVGTERIRRALALLGMTHAGGVDGRVTFSAGVASWSSSGATDNASILAEADAALYRAKAAGRDRIEVSVKVG